MSPGAGLSNSTKEALKLARELEEKSAPGDPLTQHNRNLIRWARSVDRGYAWLVLLALWLLIFSILGPYRLYGLIFAHVTDAGIYTRQEAAWPVSAILTVECLLGPVVSVIAYKISARWSILVGSILVTLGNGLAGLSDGLVMDVLLLGVVQGVGYAFTLVPYIELINEYFFKFRNLALGLALCGGTMSVFVWSPVFQWLLAHFPWRYSYFGLGALSALSLLAVIVLRPNPRPRLELAPPKKSAQFSGSSISKLSMRALSYQGSMRRQSAISVARVPLEPATSATLTRVAASNLSRQGSVVSVSPFARSTGVDRRRSNITVAATVAAAANGKLEQIDSRSSPPDEKKPADALEIVSLSEIEAEMHQEAENAGPVLPIILDILKTPAFHFIWFSEAVYFWAFSIFCLVVVDYGEDRGCTRPEAESLLNFLSIGELIGRLVLSALVDLRLISIRSTTILVLFLIAATLTLVTQVLGFYWLAAITVVEASLISVLYILLSSLLVEYLGERKVVIGFGLASCFGGVMLSVRPQVVGYFRDQHGTYDPLMLCLACACSLAAVFWIIEPTISKLVYGRGGKELDPPKADIVSQA